MEKLVTVNQYSKLKGCIPQNIYGKINRGTLERRTKKIGTVIMIIVSDEEFERIRMIEL